MKSKKLYIELLEKEVISLRKKVEELEYEIRYKPDPVGDALKMFNSDVEQQLFYGIDEVVNKKEDNED